MSSPRTALQLSIKTEKAKSSITHTDSVSEPETQTRSKGRDRRQLRDRLTSDASISRSSVRAAQSLANVGISRGEPQLLSSRPERKRRASFKVVVLSEAERSILNARIIFRLLLRRLAAWLSCFASRLSFTSKLTLDVLLVLLPSPFSFAVSFSLTGTVSQILPTPNRTHIPR